jgi:hypothetical protein
VDNKKLQSKKIELWKNRIELFKKLAEMFLVFTGTIDSFFD